MNTIVAPPIIGTLLTERDRAMGLAPKVVYAVIGQTRSRGKVRVRQWANTAGRWCRPRLVYLEGMVPAPLSWACTSRARAAIMAAYR